jgi:hypothetical protein
LTDLDPLAMRFIDEHISSIEQLEVLLLMRTRRDKAWKAEEISRELGSSPLSIAGRLADLCARRFLRAESEDPTYRYDPDPVEVDLVIAEVEKVYHTRRLSVINRIYAKPIDNIQLFSDAFRIKRKDDR